VRGSGTDGAEAAVTWSGPLVLLRFMGKRKGRTSNQEKIGITIPTEGEDK